MIIGAGNYISTPSTWSFCGIHDIPTSAIVDFCVTDYTVCSNVKIVSDVPATRDASANIDGVDTGSSSVCPSDAHEMYVLLYSSGSKSNAPRSGTNMGGWHGYHYEIQQLPLYDLFSLRKHPYRNGSYTDMLFHKGTMDAGEGGHGSMCVVDGCYMGTLEPPPLSTGGWDPQWAVGWVVCGLLSYPQAGPVFFQVKDGWSIMSRVVSC